jgi:hypothetical protein
MQIIDYQYKVIQQIPHNWCISLAYHKSHMVVANT